MASDDTAASELQGTQRKLLGSRPRPRVLVQGSVPQGAEEFLAEFVPTLETVEGLHGVNQAEWDLIVTNNLGGVEHDKRAVVFVAEVGLVDQHTRFVQSMAFRRDLSLAHSEVRINEFVRPDPEEFLAALVEQSLIPLYKNDPSRRTYFLAEEPFELLPFAVNASGHVLAGAYRHPATGALRVVLPFDIPQPESWLRGIIGELYLGEDAATFDGVRDWDSSREWITARESAVLDEIAEFNAERTRVLDDIEARELRLQTSLAAAREAARDGERRLLAGQGDELVGAVKQVLESIGFVVTMVDEKESRKGDALEDLHIEDPGRPGWKCIAEVRGYKRGAQLSDLIRISARFFPRYVTTYGEPPGGMWYIVNHHKDDPPGARPDPLESNPDEVSAFAEAGGLVIDTRVLFQLARQTTRDEDAGRLIRDKLVGQTGVITSVFD